MIALVKRNRISPKSVQGELWVEGEFFGFTLEPSPPVVPSGSYALIIRWSPRFQRLMPHVENVPFHEGILIHWGNVPKDTEGCLLVGLTRGPQPDFVGESRIAFDDFFQQLRQAQIPSTITYIGGETKP